MVHHLADRLAFPAAVRARGKTACRRGQTTGADNRGISVTVPTVERGLWLVAFCSMEIAGDRPSIRSTSGFSISCKTAGRRRTGFPHSGADPRRTGCQTPAKILPEPDRPVITIQLVSGQIQIDVFEVVRACTANADQGSMSVCAGPGRNRLIYRVSAIGPSLLTCRTASWRSPR